MENIKIYAAAYLGLGFLVSLQLWRLHKKETAPTDFVSAVLDSLRPPRPFDVLRERLLALTVILAGTFIWPFFLGDRLLKKCFSATQEPMRERVGDQYLEMPLSLANLGDVLSIKEIEAREMIEDPLNAVPRLPFGFLNHAWIVFKRRHPRARDFRPFDVMQEGSSETLAGYAHVKDGKVVDEFLARAIELSKKILFSVNLSNALGVYSTPMKMSISPRERVFNQNFERKYVSL